MKQQLICLIIIALYCPNIFAMRRADSKISDATLKEVKQLHHAIEIIDLPQIQCLANRFNVDIPLLYGESRRDYPVALDQVLYVAESYQYSSKQKHLVQEKHNDLQKAYDIIAPLTCPSLITTRHLTRLIGLSWHQQFDYLFNQRNVPIEKGTEPDLLTAVIHKCDYEIFELMIKHNAALSLFTNDWSMHAILNKVKDCQKLNYKKPKKEYIQCIAIAQKIYRHILTKTNVDNCNLTFINHHLNLGLYKELFFVLMWSKALVDKSYYQNGRTFTLLENAIDKCDYNAVRLFIQLKADIYIKPNDGNSATLFEKVIKLPDNSANNYIKQLFIQAALNRFYNA